MSYDDDLEFSSTITIPLQIWSHNDNVILPPPSQGIDRSCRKIIHLGEHLDVVLVVLFGLGYFFLFFVLVCVLIKNPNKDRLWFRYFWHGALVLDYALMTRNGQYGLGHCSPDSPILLVDKKFMVLFHQILFSCMVRGGRCTECLCC